MNLFDRTKEAILKNKEKVDSGRVNCIPLHYNRFSLDLPGVEQKTYIQITASTKVGKTQVTDDIFLNNCVKYAYHNPDKVRLKIFYFTLEMSAEQKMMQCMSNFIWTHSKSRIRATPRDLRSVSAAQISIPQEVIDYLDIEDSHKYFDFFNKTVEFIADIKNPFGIYKFMREYAQMKGTQHKKSVVITDFKTGEEKIHEIDDWYEPDDPDEYVIIIVDHMALLSPENGKTVRDAMIKLSSDYFVTLRNKYKYIPVAVVQQAAAQEGNENFKMGKLKPTLDGYGDAKIISRDADVILGLFSPYRHGLPEYEGYDIKKFRDNIRFLELIAGREGGGGNVCPLLFDGGVNYFHELPLPHEEEKIKQVYTLIDRIRSGKIIKN